MRNRACGVLWIDQFEVFPSLYANLRAIRRDVDNDVLLWARASLFHSSIWQRYVESMVDVLV